MLKQFMVFFLLYIAHHTNCANSRGEICNSWRNWRSGQCTNNCNFKALHSMIPNRELCALKCAQLAAGDKATGYDSATYYEGDGLCYCNYESAGWDGNTDFQTCYFR